MKKISTVLAAAAVVAFALTGCASTDGAVDSTRAADTAENAVPAINNPDPTGEVVPLDGFEEGNYWEAVGDTWDQWGSHNLSLDADTTEDWASEGSTAGIWEFDVMSADTSMQATFVCRALMETDWTPYKEIVVDFNNISGQPLQVNVAIQDNKEWQWTVTKTFTLGEGVNKNVTFSLKEDLMNGSNQPVDALINGDSLACGMIQVVGENTGGQIMVDNIRLVK